MAKPKDITGEKFGKLTAIKRTGKQGDSYKWLCVCECGNKTAVCISNLTSGSTKSCGCLKKNPPIMVKHGYTRHGEKREKLYNVWVSMKQRCMNPNDINYHRYGGRGISVCSEWASDYEKFREWALSNGYRQGLDLDRINNDGNYEPSNCRFVTHQQNLLNTHRKLHDNINGEDITLREAADKYGISYQTLYTRYKRGKRGDELAR